jgi:DNA-binding CsgD family transcriptional regulator
MVGSSKSSGYLLRRLARMLAAGYTLRRCARQLGLSSSTLCALAKAANLPRRRRRLPEDKRREVARLIAEGLLSQREIARRTGVSKSTVGSMFHADDEPLVLRTKRLRRPERCPACGGKIASKPCVACAALAARGGAETRSKRR